MFYVLRIASLFLTLLFTLQSSSYAKQLHFGIISAVKKKVNDLKDKKTKREHINTSVIGPDGGIIQLSDGSSVSIPTNIFKSNSLITLRKYDFPLISVGNAEVESATYGLEIPIDTLVESIDTEQDFEKVITFDIPLFSTSMDSFPSLSKSLSSTNDIYKISRVNISGGPILYGSYNASGNIAKIFVPLYNLTFLKERVASNIVSILTITTEIIDARKNYLDVPFQLFEVTFPFDVRLIDIHSPIKDGIKSKVIFIHGYNPGSDLLGDNMYDNPHKDTWGNLISYLSQIENIKTKFTFFTIRYDTKNSVDYNAKELKSIIESYFEDNSNLIIIAHSMGGLVAHAYIQRYNGNEKICKLITLGTPYHGTPIAQVASFYLIPDAFLVIKSSGSIDHRWDYFDTPELSPIGIMRNEYLLKLYKDSKINNFSTEYVTFGGSMEQLSNHSFRYKLGYSYLNKLKLLNLLKYTTNYELNDGVVPLVSARYDGFLSSSSWIVKPDYDHSQLHDGKTDNDPIFQQIQNELLKIITTPTNNPPLIFTITTSSTAVNASNTSTITCTASDPDNDILTYSWSATSGTITGSGSQVTWKAPYSSGTYTITCSVTDGKGGSDSKSINVTVQSLDESPSASITNPSDGSTVSGMVNVAINATDDNGIDNVQFYLDGILKSTDTSSPYSYTWDTTQYSNGSHIVKVVAYDTSNQTASNQNTVTVKNKTFAANGAIDTVGDVGQFCSISLDSNDNPHIVYYDKTENDLKYAKWSGSQWDFKVIDSSGTENVSSVVLDSNDKPHVSYADSGNLKYATMNGSDWDIVPIDSGGVELNSIKVDSNNFLHIVYRQSSFTIQSGIYIPIQSLKYAKWTGTTWSTTTVSAGDTGFGCSLALDGSNNPHVSFWALGGEQLKYGKLNGSWVIQNLETNLDYQTSIALDFNGNPHIVYYTESHHFRYTKWTGSSWTSPISLDSSVTIKHCSISLDSNGNPHIVYYDDSSQDIKYVKWTGSSWITPQTIDSTGAVGEYASIALDSSNNPHIIYYDRTNGNLQYIRKE